MIKIYTDGAAQGNPGPGGYGTIMKYGAHEKELSQGYELTTNNRMELMAVIAGLEAITRPGIPVTIYSDSKYVVDAVEKGWQCNDGVGCGLVAGFGQAGPSQRPGFAWYFGGDALMTGKTKLEAATEDAGSLKAGTRQHM